MLRFEEHYCVTLQKEDVERLVAALRSRASIYSCILYFFDRCKNYVRVFAELAECLVKENEERGTDIFEFPRLLDLLLVCCNHPEHEVRNRLTNHRYYRPEVLLTSACLILYRLSKW